MTKYERLAEIMREAQTLIRAIKNDGKKQGLDILAVTAQCSTSDMVQDKIIVQTNNSIDKVGKPIKRIIRDDATYPFMFESEIDGVTFCELTTEKEAERYASLAV